MLQKYLSIFERNTVSQPPLGADLQYSVWVLYTEKFFLLIVMNYIHRSSSTSPSPLSLLLGLL